MDSEEFSRHTKEEFADWVRMNIKEEELAKKILATETQKELEHEFTSAYDKHVKKIEELKKKEAGRVILKALRVEESLSEMVLNR